MGIVEALRTAWDWLKAILNRRVCTASEFSEAVTEALSGADEDADGYISVRELISATLRGLRSVR